MKYIVNKNVQISTGYHKIHTKNCPKGPKKENVIDLGDCMCPIDAKSRAKEHYANINGCRYCCKEIFYNNKIG